MLINLTLEDFNKILQDNISIIKYQIYQLKIEFNFFMKYLLITGSYRSGTTYYIKL